MAMKKISDITSLFDLNETEKELYQKLFFEEHMSASQLAKGSSISRPAVYAIVKKLIDKGLVVQSMKNGMRVFSVQSSDQLRQILEEKRDAIDRSQDALSEIEKALGERKKTFGPRFEVFEGRDAVQQMIRSALFDSDASEVYAYWPVAEVLKMLTPEFFSDYDRRRIESNIHIKAIWPHRRSVSFQDHSFLLPGRDFKREIRLAPAGADFTLGYNIRGNTVRFISSQRENFGFLVESHELAKTMRSQFDIIWKLSKPIPVKK